MDKKMIVVVTLVSLLAVIGVVALLLNAKQDTYDEFIADDTIDSNGGSVQVPEGFEFEFVNQDEFVQRVSEERVQELKSTSAEVLLYGTWTFIDVVDDNSILVEDSLHNKYTILFLENEHIIISK